jgi:UDP-N-acetylmuramate dehydrogenase
VNRDPVTLAAVREDVDAPLAPLTSLRLGGPARRMVTAVTEQEIVDTVRAADKSGEPLLILGGGSNVVIGDDGFDGTVLRIATTGVQRQRTCAGLRLGVAAGHPWDEFVAEAVEIGAVGVEALSGIPGSAGATPIQNVGAYGQEVADTVAWVRVLDRTTGEVCGLQRHCLEFAYRDSLFKHDDRYVVLTVWFGFEPPVADRVSAPIRFQDLATALGVAIGATAPLDDVRAAVLQLRRNRGMVLDPTDHDTWSAGSFFTNPVLDAAGFAVLEARVAARLGTGVVLPRYDAGEGRLKTSAAWLIERAGFVKGYGAGPARLSTKHASSATAWPPRSASSSCRSPSWWAWRCSG